MTNGGMGNSLRTAYPPSAAALLASEAPPAAFVAALAGQFGQDDREGTRRADGRGGRRLGPRFRRTGCGKGAHLLYDPRIGQFAGEFDRQIAY